MARGQKRKAVPLVGASGRRFAAPSLRKGNPVNAGKYTSSKATSSFSEAASTAADSRSPKRAKTMNARGHGPGGSGISSPYGASTRGNVSSTGGKTEPKTPSGHDRGLQNQRIYKQAATALTRLLAADVSKRGGAALKSLTLAQGNVAKKATHALTCETLKLLPLLQQVTESAGLVAPTPQAGDASKRKRRGKPLKLKPKPQATGALWPELVYVVAYDLLFGSKQAVAAAAGGGGGGGGPPGAPTGQTGKGVCSAVLKTVVSRRAALESALARLVVKEGAGSAEELAKRYQRGAAGAEPADGASAQGEMEGAVVHPRYARVNTLKSSLEDVLRQLGAARVQSLAQLASTEGTQVDNGCEVSGVDGDSDGEREGEADVSGPGIGGESPGKPQQNGRTNQRQPQEDPLIPNVLRFPPGTDLHAHPLVKSGHLILQGKASCIPAAVLDPMPGWHVLDACAAPGNKTTHLAAVMSGEGRISACERDPKRARLLRESVARAGASGMVSVVEGDFLALDTESEEYRDVEAVLVDPSCSGSGTVASRMDHLLPSFRRSGPAAASGGGEADGDSASAAAAQRIEKLARFQEAALRHALGFPSARRVVYSTCSVEERENEGVVANVLDQAEQMGFQLAPALPGWERRGLPKYSFGSMLVRTDPVVDGMDGFFVALFVREGSGVSPEVVRGSKLNGKASKKKR